jgi:nucleotide-binding universal stress UspA family protein
MGERGGSAPGEAGNDATRLLVPLDGSEAAQAALPYALALATPGAELILLTVVPEDEAAASGDPAAATPEDQARAALELVAKGVRQSGHAVRIEVAVGDPTARIVDTAADMNATMIVMTSHGRGALGRLIFGSVADGVSRTADVPVMIVRAGKVEPGPVGITRLLVPLDGSPRAEESLPVATAISRRLGTPLVLVQVINPAALLTPASGIGGQIVPPDVYDETAGQMERDAHDYLDGVARRLRQEGLPVVTQVLTGSATGAIMNATALGDVIVLTSHGRSGVERWLLGSVAEQLVREAPAPVILVPSAERAEVAR